MTYKFIQCTNCKTWHFDHEPCPPVFIIHHAGVTDKGKVLRARTIEQAADKYAGLYNGSTNNGLIDKTAIIEVEDESGAKEKFYISAARSIEYTVSRKPIE